MSFQISVAFGRRLQVEDFVVLWRPAGVLGLGHLPPLLVGEVRPDEANLDEGLESLHLGPPQVVGGNDWKGRDCDVGRAQIELKVKQGSTFNRDFVLAGSRMRVKVDLNRYLASIPLIRGRRV